MANHTPGHSDEDRCDANARLTAAAPDLYDALSALVKYPRAIDLLPNAFREQIRAALAKVDV